MSYMRRIAYNTVIQVIGRFFTTAVSLATVSILNAQLGDERWGLYVAATTYLGFFAVVADLGVNTLYLREISRFPERVEEITAEFLGFRTVTAVIVLALAPLTALLVPVYHGLAFPILIASIGQLFLILNQIFVSIVQARLLMDRAMLSDVCGRAVILIGTILFVHSLPIDHRLQGALWALVAGNALNTVMMYFFVRPFLKVKLRFMVRTWPRLFLSTLPMGALTVLGLIHFKADSVILTLVRPAVEVGIYGNAYKIIEIMLTLPSMFVGGLFPAMSQALHRKEANFEVFMQKAFDILVFVSVPLVGAVFIFAPFIIAVLTREHITESAHALRILSLAMFPLFIGNLFGNILLAADKQKQLSLFELGACVLNIGLNLLLIPRFAYYGAASTTLISEILITCFTAYLSARVIGKAPRGGQVIWAIILGLPVICIAGYVLSYIPSIQTAFFQWSRWTQVGSLLVAMVLYSILYVVPFLLTRKFPPVVQERLHKLLPAL